MHICYFDEAGDTRELPLKRGESTASPVFVLGGVSVNARELRAINSKMMDLKVDFLEGKAIRHEHDYIRGVPPEIKGGYLRGHLDGPKPGPRIVALLDGVLEVFRQHDVKILARVHIKIPGASSRGEDVYNRAVQLTFKRFQDRLDAIDHDGFVIADSRDPKANEAAAHSIYVEKFLAGGDKHPRILEMPTFGNSQNHIGLQLADIVCSALLFPIAHARYVDADHGDAFIADRYAAQIETAQLRFIDNPKKQVDGIWIGDLNGKPLSRAHLFS